MTNFTLTPERRLAIARVTAAAMMASQLLMYRPLWLDRSFPSGPPTLPLFSWFPSLPDPGGMIVWALMLGACAVAAVGRWARPAAIGIAAAYALMLMFDQSRWQAHIIIGPVVLLLLTLSAPTPRDSLRRVQLSIASIYFFAGLGKLNIGYATLVHPAMMQPLMDHVPALVGSVLAFPWIVPVTEMLMGGAAFSPGGWKTRRIVLVAAVSMHAFILTMLLLGSLDIAVVPFNLGLAVLAFVTLYDREDAMARPQLRPMLRSAGGLLAVAYAIVVPVLSIIGFADNYLAHAYYSGSEARSRWFASAAAAARLNAVPWPADALVEGKLPRPKMPPGVRPVGDGNMVNVPFYALTNFAFENGVMGEARIAERVKERLCEFAAHDPDDIIVRFLGPANPITGDRVYRDANCAESLGFWLRLGGLHTIVIGGDEPTYVFEQHGDPKF